MNEVHTYNLFEIIPHKGTTVLPIDTVAGDGHQVTFGGHDVTQQGQMPIVDIKTVKVQHEKDFFLHSSPHSFNAQNLETRKK